MPYYVVQKTVDALNERGIPIKSAKVLMLGLAYKKDVDDTRESPSLKLIELFLARGARVDYNDPYIPTLPRTRKYNIEKDSVSLTAGNLGKYDCVIIATDHSAYDSNFILKNSDLIIDTRNVFKISLNDKTKVRKA